MKRPFAVVGFTMFVCLFASAFIGRSDVAFCALVVSVAAGVASLFKYELRQDMRLPMILFSAALSCLLFLSADRDMAKVQSLTGENVSVRAIVYEAPYRNSRSPRHYVVCELEEVSGTSVNGRIKLSFLPSESEIDPDSLEVGNIVSFTATVYIPGKSEKSIERYFQGESILLGAYGIENFTVSEPSRRGVTYYFQKIRTYVTDTLSFSFSDKVAGVLTGILTGDKSCLDEELYSAFRKSGVAHLMAVSGLHLTVWVFFIGGLIPENRRYSLLKYSLLIFVTVFIMLLAGMSESVKRAGFMSIIYLLGKMGRRKADSLNSLGLAVTLMLLYNPLSVLSVSFQLSLLSTLAIITLGKEYMKGSARLFGSEKINRKPRKLLRLCTDSFSISISVLIFTLPVLLNSFGGISTVSAFTNILLIPVTTPLLILTGFYVLISGFTALSYPLSLVITVLTEYLAGVTKLFSGVKNSFLLFSLENLPLYLAGGILIALFSFIILKESSRHKLKAVIASLLICTLLVSFYESRDKRLNVYLEVIGEELVCVAENDGRAVIVGDVPTYERNILISSFEEKGIEITAVLENSVLKSLDNGKSLRQEEIWNNIRLEKYGNGYLLDFYGNKISLFAPEHLQEDNNCDIIAEIFRNKEQDLILCLKDEELSAREKGSLCLTLKRNSECSVRGEFSWQNLMKSN